MFPLRFSPLFHPSCIVKEKPGVILHRPLTISSFYVAEILYIMQLDFLSTLYRLNDLLVNDEHLKIKFIVQIPASS